jgi:hypothetical protein
MNTLNEPAFPSDELWNQGNAAREINQQFQGMSLRDYFAAKALQGYMVGVDEPNALHASKTAYLIADAMLAERVK